MTQGGEYAVALAPRKDSRQWSQDTITWDTLVDWVQQPADHKECGNYLLGTLRGGRRTKNAIVSRSAVQLDADRADGTLFTDVQNLPYRALVHTTFNSAPDSLRLRIIIPLDREVTPDEYTHIAHVLMNEMGADKFDPGSTQPERYMFRPAAQNRDWYRHAVVTGPEAAADQLLASFSTDLSTVPAPRPSRTKKDPQELPGVVGAFNRAYTIDEAIEAFSIPYTKVAAGRWQLEGARAEAGLHEVTPELVFSHHAGDPAYGMTCSAFDLVRVHLYGILDEQVPDDTPVHKLPSHEAALEALGRDTKVLEQLVGEFSDEPDDPTPPSGPDDPDDPAPNTWLMDLRRNARSGKVNDEVHNWDLIGENDPVLRSLWWDELDMSVKADRDLPWRSLEKGEVFTGTDRANLRMHIERAYGVRPPRELLDDLVNTRAQRRSRNPVVEYLDTLQWDGTPRLEECLPGVVPTEYTRTVARKALVAAVARMYDPGCKWDHTLIIYGAEGRGKTFWIDRMSRGYTTSLGDIHNKDTLLTMQRSWIVTSDEGFSMRKADADSLKEFLTRTTDTFRLPYEREVMAYPRHCVIWGTTNDPTFLRRQEGNRRYLIVHAEEKLDFARMTDHYVDQVWAEAVHLYHAGEPLFLNESESMVAAQARERYVEEDTLTGVIEEWLDTPVPDNWEDMTPDQRREWRVSADEGFGPAGTQQIQRTCSTQIWVECLGRRLGEHRRADLLEITKSLRALPGWRPLDKRQRLPHYGPQLVFERVPELDNLL